MPITLGAGLSAILAGGSDRSRGSLSDGKIVTIVTGRISARTGAAGITGSPVGLPCSQHADTALSDGEPEDGIDERMLRDLAERVRNERLRHNLRWSARQLGQAEEGRPGKGRTVPPRR
jgi:hypothetical protein